MNPISRKVILDLLPVYLAGEASEDTRALIEEFARDDPETADLIRAGASDPFLKEDRIALPEHLEIRTIKRVRRAVRRRMVYVALATASILLIPLIASRYSAEVNWSPMDFIVMALLLFGAGAAFVLLTRVTEALAYRLAAGVAVGTGFVLIWLNLAVGLIGSPGNPANLLYVGVLIVAIAGAWIARLQPRGMSRAMLAAAAVQLIIPAAALITGTPALEQPPGVIGVVILNTGFAVLLGLSALLFRQAARRQQSA